MKNIISIEWLIRFVNYVNKLLFDKNVNIFIAEYEKQIDKILPVSDNEDTILTQYLEKKKKLISTKTQRRNLFGIFLASFFGQYKWLSDLQQNGETETFFAVLGGIMLLTLGILFIITKSRLKAYKCATELITYEKKFLYIDNEFTLSSDLKYNKETKTNTKNKFMSSTNLYRFVVVLVFIGELKMLFVKIFQLLFF